MKRMMMITLILALGLVAGIVTATLTQPGSPKAATLFGNARTLELPLLVDERNTQLAVEAFAGQWDLLFFGFTHCPDVCPMTLERLRTTVEQLPEKRRPRIWLVSVDPTRDTPDTLRQYVQHFDPGFRAVTGTEDAISLLARQLGVAYARMPQGDSYTMSHSAALFLIDPNGLYAGLFNAPHDWRQITADLKTLLK